MTREEAIKKLQRQKAEYLDEWVDFSGIAEAYDMAIKALEQEPCDDAISRQSMHIELEKWIIYGEYKYSNATKYLYDRIDRLPSVTTKQKMGKWINQHIIYDNATIDFKVCSECRYEFSYDAETGVSDANYCPNCGAKMVESEERE